MERGREQKGVTRLQKEKGDKGNRKIGMRRYLYFGRKKE